MSFFDLLLQDYFGAIVTACFVAVFGLIAFIRLAQRVPHTSSGSSGPVDDTPPTQPKKNKSTEAIKSSSKAASTKPMAAAAPAPDYHLIYKRLKGFKGQTMAAFSPDEGSRYLAVITLEDRAAKVYFTKSLTTNDHRNVQLNLTSDTPTWCSFDKSGHYIVFALADSGTLVAYQLSEKKNKEGRHYSLKAEFPREHKTAIKNLVFAPNAQYIVSCGTDTSVKVWNLKGGIIASLDTKQIQNNTVAVSPDSRWIACGAWTGDVKIWEANTNKKTGAFEGIKPTPQLQLKGHTSGVRGVSFSADSMHVVTCSADRTWKYWNLNLEYAGSDPKCELTVPTGDEAGFHGICLSPDSSIAATYTGCNLEFWMVPEGTLLESIESAHTKPITSVSWTADSKMIVTGSHDATCILWKRPER